jgi:alkaline phosphatase
MHNSSRRTLGLVLALLAVAFAALPGVAEETRVGLFTDLHAHEADSPGEKKVMTNYAERLSAFVDAMNAWGADLVLQLGDLINGQYVQLAPYVPEERYPVILADTVALLAGYEGPVYHVLGNHDVYSLSKAQFLEGTGASTTYYSFDAGGFHFVVLDAQYTKAGADRNNAFWFVDGTVPEAQLAWLQDDLGETALPTIVCIHQPLDVESSTLTGDNPIIINNAEVKDVLQASGVVVAVFQGHEHENRYTLIEGIHYVTFQAMVDHTEPTVPAWARITLDPDARTILIEGHGDQVDRALPY